MSFVFGAAFINNKNRLEAGGPFRNGSPPSLAVSYFNRWMSFVFGDAFNARSHS